jgi:hypothetical protein
MTDATNKGAPKTSIAGGAHYHAILATEKWKAFAEAMDDHATRSAAERAETHRERLHRARSAEEAGTDQKGT